MKNPCMDPSPNRTEPAPEHSLFQALLAQDRGEPASPQPAQGVVVGTLVALTGRERTPWVGFAGQPGAEAVCASSVVSLDAADLGQAVVLMFECGDVSRPIVMGVRRPAGDGSSLPAAALHVEADGERLLVSASKQLTLQCGKASITLTAAGKVLIQGSYVSSRSTGLHRIRGAAIQLN